MNVRPFLYLATLCASIAFEPVAALAHATLEKPEAVVGGSYKAVMRIPHGCGGLATLKVRIRIPDGFVGVKPMPKAGWKLETVVGKYDKTYQLLHGKLTEGVREISWTGNLPNEWYDEFVFVGTVADGLTPGSIMWFPTVQECEGAAERWIEIPENGQTPHELKSPAPGLKLLPKP
jgi:periplasmic copper chaperone A